ncbi:MAG TPA: hypothetical protein ENK57_19060 [Polyangiaceae bacterium]|nr:hypothetical protein [Polyangiaceae bacterium]
MVPPEPPLVDHGGVDGFADLRTPEGERVVPAKRLFDVERTRRRLLRCIDRQLKSDPDAAGFVHLHIRLDVRGRVVEVTSDHSPHLDVLAACFRHAVAGGRFASTGEPATLTLPIHLAPR